MSETELEKPKNPEQAEGIESQPEILDPAQTESLIVGAEKTAEDQTHRLFKAISAHGENEPSAEVMEELSINDADLRAETEAAVTEIAGLSHSDLAGADQTAENETKEEPPDKKLSRNRILEVIKSDKFSEDQIESALTFFENEKGETVTENNFERKFAAGITSWEQVPKGKGVRYKRYFLHDQGPCEARIQSKTSEETGNATFQLEIKKITFDEQSGQSRRVVKVKLSAEEFEEFKAASIDPEPMERVRYDATSPDPKNPGKNLNVALMVYPDPRDPNKIIGSRAEFELLEEQDAKDFDPGQIGNEIKLDGQSIKLGGDISSDAVGVDKTFRKMVQAGKMDEIKAHFDSLLKQQ